MPLHVQKQEPHRLSRLQLLQLGIFQSWQPVSTCKQHESHGHNHRFRQLPCAGLQMCCKRCKKTMLIQMARSRCHLEKRCPKNKVGFSRELLFRSCHPQPITIRMLCISNSQRGPCTSMETFWERDSEPL